MKKRFPLFLIACLAAVPAVLGADSVVVEEIIAQKVIGQEVGSHIQVTKEEEQKFYDQHKDELQQPETVRLSEILISTQKAVPGDKAAPADPDAQQLAAAEAKAKDLLDQTQKGASFEAVAKKNPDGPTEVQGCE